MTNDQSAGGVSVVVAYYNRSRLFKRLLDSILLQDMAALELIIVDNGSSYDDIKELWEIIQSNNCTGIDLVLVSTFKRYNANYARNLGMDLARSNYVAFIDSDDWWEKNHLSTSVDILRKNKTAACYCSVIEVDGDFLRKKSARDLKPGELPTDYLFVNKKVMQTSGIVVDKKLIDRTRWDERLRRHQDYDFYFQLYSYASLSCNPNFGVYLDRSDSLAGRVFDFKSMIRFYSKWFVVFSPKSRSSYLKNQLYICSIVGADKRYARYYKKRLMNDCGLGCLESLLLSGPVLRIIFYLKSLVKTALGGFNAKSLGK